MIENVRERKGVELYKEVESNQSACKINIRWGKAGLESPSRRTDICTIEIMIICCANHCCESKLAVSYKIQRFLIFFSSTHRLLGEGYMTLQFMKKPAVQRLGVIL